VREHIYKLKRKIRQVIVGSFSILSISKKYNICFITHIKLLTLQPVKRLMWKNEKVSLQKAKD
jgi:hypothetical protein